MSHAELSSNPHCILDTHNFTAHVSFRVPDHTKDELEVRAGSSSISQYMIELIRRNWQRADQYAAIEAALDDLRASQRSGDSERAPLGLHVELLLLCEA